MTRCGTTAPSGSVRFAERVDLTREPESSTLVTATPTDTKGTKMDEYGDFDTDFGQWDDDPSPYDGTYSEE